MRFKYPVFLFLFLLHACVEQTTTRQNEEKTEQKASEKDKAEVEEASPKSTKNIVIFGNSLTAGLGVEPEDAFPARLQAKLDSLGLDYRVVSAGESGSTSAGGVTRIDWVAKNQIDVFILELGGNDGLRGVPTEEMHKNLQSIIDVVTEKHPEAKIVLAGMEAPPNMGEQYTSSFRKVFQDLREANNLILIPFLLEGVGGVPDLNQPDGIHPTPKGHQILADNIWKVLKGIL